MAQRHKWTEEEERALAASVAELTALHERFAAPRDVFWAGVVGHAKLDVTSRAARSRWEAISKRRKEAGEAAWETVEARVAEYERSIAEETRDEVAALRTQANLLQEILLEQNRLLETMRLDVAKLLKVKK